MSFCRVTEIAKAATIDTVKTIEDIIYRRVGYNLLYTPSSTWRVNLDYSYDPDTLLLNLNYAVSSISSMEYFVGGNSVVEDNADRTYNPSRKAIEIPSTFADEFGFPASDSYLEITGVRGVGQPVALSAGDDVYAGQTVLRGTSTLVLFEEDGTAQAGDQLLVAPSMMRSMAITFGGRILAYERDYMASLSEPIMQGWEKQIEDIA